MPRWIGATVLLAATLGARSVNASAQVRQLPPRDGSAPNPTTGTSVIRGRVVDAQTGASLVRARVSLDGGGAPRPPVLTDEPANSHLHHCRAARTRSWSK